LTFLTESGFYRNAVVLRGGGLLIFDALNRHSYKLIMKKLGRSIRPQFSGRLSDKWIDVFSFREILQIVGQTRLHLQAAIGYGWPPFAVNSDSKLVNAAASVERVLRLDRFPHVSPRIVMAARKESNHGQVDCNQGP
jgi:hypothetical protein